MYIIDMHYEFSPIEALTHSSSLVCMVFHVTNSTSKTVKNTCVMTCVHLTSILVYQVAVIHQSA